ncbi:hypothetical protein ACFLT7_05765 [candidate division KSB1 bacterium]
MELLPVGQGLKLVRHPQTSAPDRAGEAGLFVAQPGRIARDQSLSMSESPVEQRSTTHPVLDLVYRPEIRRAISESDPPRPVRRYPQVEQRQGESVGSFLNVMI